MNFNEKHESLTEEVEFKEVIEQTDIRHPANGCTEEEPGETTESLPAVENNSISARAVEDLEFVNLSVNSAWDIFCRNLHAKLGGTDEAAEWIAANTAYMRKCAVETSVVAVELSRYVEEFVIPSQKMSAPVTFKLTDLVIDTQRKSTYLPPQALNTWGAGTDDPNWETGPLPVEQVINFVKTGITKIPVKCETNSSFVYGYLELFTYQTLHEGKIVNMMSEFPAIRVKDKYLSISYVTKWKNVEEKDVKNIWLRCNGVIDKKAK